MELFIFYQCFEPTIVCLVLSDDDDDKVFLFSLHYSPLAWLEL